jgi:hypothetical protein
MIFQAKERPGKHRAFNVSVAGHFADRACSARPAAGHYEVAVVEMLKQKQGDIQACREHECYALRGLGAHVVRIVEFNLFPHAPIRGVDSPPFARE